MGDIAPIRLADEAAFTLGDGQVEPASRRIVRGGGVTVIEPRTMQVLVLLARAPGEVVGRQALVDACWDGRIVGEDAVNRAILKLRRALEEAGATATIETVARVGYRLIHPETASPSPTGPAWTDRRGLLLGGAAVAVSITAIGYLGWPHGAGRPPRAQELYDRGEIAFQQGSRDDNAQAVGFFRQAAALAPHDAAIAGALALALRFEQTFRGPALLARSTAQADAATARALALDAHDPDAIAARSMYVPFGNHWYETERRLRDGLAEVPGSGVMNGFLGMVLAAVGRTHEAIAAFDHAVGSARFVPLLRAYLINSLFAVGRIGDADRELEAAALWPRFAELRWLRFWTLALTGRIEAAGHHIAAKDGLPLEIQSDEMQAARVALAALADRSAAATDAALLAWSHLANRTPG